MIHTQRTHQLPWKRPHTDLWKSGYIRCNDERRKASLLMRDPRNGRQSQGLIQQSSPCSNTWLGTFCLHSCRNQPLGVDGWHALCPRNHKQENLWWLNHLIAWKYSSAHREAEPLTLELWWSQELPNHCCLFFFFFFYFNAVAWRPNFHYVNHPGHDGILAGLTLECIALYQTLCTSNILGMQKEWEI